MAGLPMNTSFPFRTRIGLSLTRLAGHLLSRIKPNPIFLNESGQYYYNLGFDQFFLTEARLANAFERMFQTIKGIQQLSQKHSAEFYLVLHPSQYVFGKNDYNVHSEKLYSQALATAQFPRL